MGYLKWASLILEQKLDLERCHPKVYDKLIKGHFLVQRTVAKFNAVSVHMTLKQTINRSQKSTEGIIGQTKVKDYITEWELAYHEVLLSRKAFPGLLNITQVVSELRMHHELTGSLRNQMEANIQQMLQYVESRENPYL